MKKLTLLCLLLFFGCEMHEQENIVQGETEARVVNLSLLEELTTAIVQNDVSYVIEKLSVGSFEINVPNKEGELILNKAVENKRLTIGYYLIKGGANPDSEDDEPRKADYDSMTVAQLKKILKKKGMTVSGKKADLIARLKE